MVTLIGLIFKSAEMCSHMIASLIICRRVTLKIALLLLVAICLWTRYQLPSTSSGSQSASTAWCRCQQQQQPSHHRVYQQNKTSTNSKKILIISEARSGSSFLGDLLQQASTTYYSFEPLIGIEPNSPLYESLIFDIFNCHFDQLNETYLKPIYWKIQYFRWNSALTASIGQQNAMQLFNQTLHHALCTQADVLLIKTIRFTLADYVRTIGLSADTDRQPIKVIFLVRDPRATMSSRYRMIWCQQSENCTSSEVLCQRMRHNIEMMQHIRIDSKLASNVALIRHEDLIGDILHTTTRLLQFLQMDSLMNHRLVQWIQEHTSVDDVLSNPHSTYRNIKGLASQWKTDLSSEELLEIETNCDDVMHQLGYRPVSLNRTEELIEQENTQQMENAEEDLESDITSDYPLSVVSV